MKLNEADENGDHVSDEIFQHLFDYQIRQIECLINGWVLNGFPEIES